MAESACPDSVKRLVERFHRNLDAYKSDTYKETRVRVDFIDPLFESLGWDVHNKLGYAEAYRDVVHEAALKVGGKTNAPDYCFRIGGTRKFFLEAKKPSVKIKDADDPAFQLRRYAWSAKLPLSILTDFEEFAVYDCRLKPDKKDAPGKARTLYTTFDKYEAEWDRLEDTFSKRAVLEGSFDKYVESAKKKRGTMEVDDAFLKEIESWRELLAKNIRLRNKDLKIRELNTAVQRTIDRIVFLRICEDRGIEPYAQLQALISGADTYGRLKTLFHKADDRYNSGLFHFRHEKDRTEPDRWTLQLAVDDKPLKDILKRLYYPESPYEFSVLPADILGQVYEQFLGKVITIKGRSLKIEEKPEVKKAGGVYYTPTYIVDYIVENTVGKLLEGKKPDRIAGKGKGKHPIRVLDPACGSGSFLIGAYQYLLDWYLDQYTRDKNTIDRHTRGRNPRIALDPTFRRLADSSRNPIPDTRTPPSPEAQTVNPGYRLTTEERKRILLDHIYGVDIDPQAVEVTKLSLLLKVLEGETEQTLQSQLDLFHSRALPDLANNIKCGNSLIGPDFYENQLPGLTEADHYRINVFDWQKEFPHVFKTDNRGFDAVIGNPPYGAYFGKDEKRFLKSAYRAASSRFDSYVYFIERSIYLIRENGLLSFITPELFLRLDTLAALREMMVKENQLDRVRIWGEGVFKSATVNTLTFLLRKGKHDEPTLVETELESYPLSISDWESNKGYVIDYRITPQIKVVFQRLRSVRSLPLSSFGEVIQGITPYDRYTGQDPHLIKQRAYHSKTQVDETYGQWLRGRNVTRYSLSWGGEWLAYGDWLAAPREPRFFEGQRLLFREVPGRGKRIQATLATAKLYHGHSITPFKPYKESQIDIRYLLGVVNSKLTSWYGGILLPNFGKDIFPKLNPQDIKDILIPEICIETVGDTAHHDRMVELVDRMLDLHKRLQTAKTAHDKSLLQRQIDATDTEIDRLVYNLYGLTQSEIKLVEEATQ